MRRRTCSSSATRTSRASTTRCALLRPVYGDDVFGFISSDGVVKIHRHDCPNARNIREKYPYRLISVKWSGEGGALMPVTVRVVGHDDIGIVTNITSIISKEKNAQLRGISINSNDGLFHGELTVGVSDRTALTALLKKISTRQRSSKP